MSLASWMAPSELIEGIARLGLAWHHEKPLAGLTTTAGEHPGAVLLGGHADAKVIKEGDRTVIIIPFLHSEVVLFGGLWDDDLEDVQAQALIAEHCQLPAGSRVSKILGYYI